MVSNASSAALFLCPACRERARPSPTPEPSSDSVDRVGFVQSGSDGAAPLPFDGPRGYATAGTVTNERVGGPAAMPADLAAKAASAVPDDPRSRTAGAATLWLTEEAWALSIWRGEVDAPDRLRIDGRDGSVHELRLEREAGMRAPIKLGRAAQVGAETNELVYPDVASRLAAVFRHDGTRWWILRREECSVPVEVGPRALARGEEAPLVHGLCVVVGGMRAIFADRRYVTFSVPTGAVDPVTGLLGRTGLELELAIALRRKQKTLLFAARDPAAPQGGGDYPPLARFALEVHRALPALPVAVIDDTLLVLSTNEADAAHIERVAPPSVALGLFPVRGGGAESAGRELELALSAIAMRAEHGTGKVSLIRDEGAAEIASAEAVVEAARSDKRVLVLFGIESQHALEAAGRHVLTGLEEELAAVVKAHGGAGVIVGPMARGVIGAAVPRKQEASALAYAVQCDWHARPPIVDGRAELPRSLSWESVMAARPSQSDARESASRESGVGSAPTVQSPAARAQELSRECADPAGVLSSLGGGLPYPIAGRVAALSSARSGVERVKMLFDVLEGTWRFMAAVVVAAFVSGDAGPNPAPPAALAAFADFMKRNATRDGYALGSWRELARHAAAGLDNRTDPIALMAREVMGVRLNENQTFDTLSNLLQAERNQFAHGQYTEASAEADLGEFEQMTRTLLRALRPLSCWTLVTVEKTEPDMYGEQQMVEFIDHTGASPTGVRRRIGLMSTLRLAKVTYLARWREGHVLPLEPFLRRLPVQDRFDLYWMDHLPRPGNCTMSAVIGGQTTKSACDARRLPPLLRRLLGAG